MIRSLCAWLLLLAAPGTALAVPVSAYDVNVHALAFAAAGNTSMIRRTLGTRTGHLALAGTLGETRWSFTLSGEAGGQGVSLAFSGAFDVDSGAGTFSVAGTVAGLPWSGGGDWTFAPVDEGRLEGRWDGEAEFGAVAFPDLHSETITVRCVSRTTLDGRPAKLCTDFTTLRPSEGGRALLDDPVESYVSRYVILGEPAGPPDEAGFDYASRIPGQGISLRIAGELPAGTVTGRARIPEPPALALLAAALRFEGDIPLDPSA